MRVYFPSSLYIRSVTDLLVTVSIIRLHFSFFQASLSFFFLGKLLNSCALINIL